MVLKLKRLYYDPRSPASFSSAERLFKEAKKIIPEIRRKQVQQYLNSQRTYTLYRRSVERYKRLKTKASGLHTDWQADLMDVRNMAHANRNFNYILVCIDVLSRMVYVKPLKNKTSDNMIKAFAKIFEEEGVVPWRLFTDNGKEFTSNAMQNFYKDHEIIKLQAMTHDILHATMAERTIRTLRERLVKYFNENSTRTWINVIDDIVYGMNHRIHSTTKMRPIDVSYENAEELRSKLYDDQYDNRKPRYNVGDFVRISTRKKVFKKTQNTYTHEIFQVIQVLGKRNPIVYRLQDLKGENILGYFYEPNLVAVSNID